MKLPMWLISYSYRAVFYHANGHISMVGPTSTVVLTELHPAKFIADLQRDFEEARSGMGERRGDMLDTVFFALEVPDGTLTEDEADNLS